MCFIGFEITNHNMNQSNQTKETHDDLEYDVDGTLLPSPRRAEHFADRWR